MKKLLVISIILSSMIGMVYAAEEASAVKDAAVTAATTAVKEAEKAIEAPAAPAAPEVPAVPAVPAAPAAPAADVATQAAAAADNLEFVSGEISATDEATKTITVKLYGEADAAAKDKTLSIKIDTTTDITDGEKDRDFKSLTAGTEVDVEYDPTTNKATYIFVY